MEFDKIGSNKVLVAVPILVLVLASAFLLYQYSSTGEWFERSIELRGGTLVSVKTTAAVDLVIVEDSLAQAFGDVSVRELSSFTGSSLTVQVDAGIDPDEVKAVLEGLGIDTTESSVQVIGPSLGESFWSQAQMAIIAAFIVMGVIVFVIFRTPVPSGAVIIAVVFDLIATLAIMQILGLQLSLASFAALLMLIGYSIDTNILLTSRVIRNDEGHVKDRVSGAFKTGMTMTITTLAVLIAVTLSTASTVLYEIAAVLLIGLSVDVLNTWLLNATIIRKYAEKRGL